MSVMAEVTSRPAPARTPSSTPLLQRCGDHPCSPGGCEGDSDRERPLVSGRAKLTAIGDGSPLLRRKIDLRATIQAPGSPANRPTIVLDPDEEEEVGGVNVSAALAPPGWVAQAKLTVGAPDDAFEREADLMADRVLHTPEVAHALPLSAGTAGAVQRRCRDCDDEKTIQTKRASGRARSSEGLTGDALGTIRGTGQSLPGSTRAFFERRFGHDFSAVRVHTDSRADRLARSVSARAFTHANDIVFRHGEYAPHTFAGRHLLAHELTHTVQQGASPPIGDVPAPSRSRGVPQLQRLGDLTQRDPALRCPLPPGSPGSSGTSVLFGTNSAALSATARTLLSSVAAAWHSGGGAGTLQVDGFASTSGQDPLNWDLSCRRAEAVAAELMAPSDGTPGVPGTNVTVFAHGETTEFSARVLAQNQRVTLTTFGGAPAPGPPCPLAITGPTTVDHYCAAYVPSDAAACGTFPAPNITLTATGAAPGATLTWGVVGGAARAGIVGANVGPSISVQGLARSAARDDVTIQVTNGTCTVTRRLTVLEPSSFAIVQAPTTTPTFVQNLITYTVQDQFGTAMSSGICVDETITVCANNVGATFTFGDAPTNLAGQVQDNLSATAPGGFPAGMCVKLNQTLTAGGCGPLQQNTIVMRPTGVVLNPGTSCAVGGPCP